MHRRTIARLSQPFPIWQSRPKDRDKRNPYEAVSTEVSEFTNQIKKDDGVAERGQVLTTKNRDESVEMHTYITQDGGRVDWVKKQWPPKRLSVRPADLEEVRVKHGTPWPSLYPALEVFDDSVTLRYVIDSSQPGLSALASTSHCPQCVNSTDGLLRPLRLDEATESFVSRCIYSPVSRWRYYLYTWLVDLGFYRYAAADLTGVCKVHLLSKAQARDLLGLPEDSVDSVPPFRTCLDVGAGAGDVSEVFQGLVEENGYQATEVSPRLVKALKKRGIKAHHSDSAAGLGEFDLVLCLNVLDRCSSITKLLDEVVNAVAPGGKLVISLPLPLRQAQHRLGMKQELLWPPSTNLPCAWEFATAWFAGYVTDRYGGARIKLLRIARSPYLANGPATAPLSVLDAALFVFEKTTDKRYTHSLGPRKWEKTKATIV